MSFAFAAGLICAQIPPPLEIRGTVAESGLGLAGVTVTLYEFGHTPAEATTRSVFATTSTDPKGEFTFHPARTGEYYVEAQKEGYFAETFDGPSAEPMDSVGDSVSLDQDHPSQQRRFTLIRLGQLRGRVIDEDGKPLSNLRVGLLPATSTQVLTDPDGYFTATKLRPGDYLVRIGPERGSPEILRQFSESDLNIVDEDLETSFWPSVPIPVSSGASLSVGTITVRKAAYYRAHLSVQSGDCEPDENWQLAVRTGDALDLGTSRQVPCAEDFLVRNLLPGLHSFVLSTDDQRRKEKHWAATSAAVTDHNLEVTMTMSAGADIIGRLVAADGAALPDKTTVVVTPVLRGWGFTTRVSDAGGTFQVHSLPGDPSHVSARDMGAQFYVKEVRYNGLPVSDGVFTPVPGPANLEIVIDDKAATITGSVAERGKVAGPIMIVAVKWPLAPDSSSVSMLLRKSINTPADEQGQFQINGLEPGEYRVFGVTETTAMRLKPDILIGLLDRAEKVTLERGGSQTLSLKIVEP
jgi:hypothetical protein